MTSHPQCSHWKEVLDLFCKGYLKYLIKPIPQIIMNESLQNTIPPFVKNAVFAIWDSQVQSKNLNNHKIIKVDGFLKDQLWISQVDYAFYYAQNYQSSLKSILQVKPLALSGTIHYQDEVLIGRRSSEVTNFQGFYEFPPSGSFEDIELTKHIYKELTEETYLKDVTSVQFISLIYDLEEEIYEIYVQIRVNSKGNPEETEEYSNLTWVNLEELQKAINQVNFVPLSRFIYENYLDPRP